jgi:hypothetical protein
MERRCPLWPKPDFSWTNIDLVLKSRGWRYVDHAKIYKCTVEAAFSPRGRSKVSGDAIPLELFVVAVLPGVRNLWIQD